MISLHLRLQHFIHVNPLVVVVLHHRFRQYGLWERYADLYPDQDLMYTVGVSDYKKDWFYAHVTRFVYFL